MTEISVIVPCYNAGKFIDRCMESLVSQTIGLQRMELILVNDASTDDTLEKLKAWEKRYPESVLVITYEENIRQGGARNVGIQYATGKYIGFVDADDWVEPDMYEALLQPTKEKEYDVVKGKFLYETSEDKWKKIDNSASQDVNYEFERINGYYIGEVSNVGNIGQYGTIPTGIYKREMIAENELWFPEKIAYEDNYWEAVLSLYTKSLYIVDKVVYHYVFHDDSTTNARNNHHLDRLPIEVAIVEAYKERGMLEACHNKLEMEFIQRYYLNTMYIIFTRYDDIPDIFEQMKNTIYEYFPDFEKNEGMKKLGIREQALIQLLKVPGTLSEKELQEFKNHYLNTFKKC